MLTTQKLISVQETVFGFPKNPVVLNNTTANEIYVQIQPYKVQPSPAEAATLTTELNSAGYTISTPIFVSGFNIKLDAGMEFKTLIQTGPTDSQVFLLWQSVSTI